MHTACPKVSVNFFKQALYLPVVVAKTNVGISKVRHLDVDAGLNPGVFLA